MIMLIHTEYRGSLHEWSFHMKFMKRAFGEFHKFHMKRPRVKDSVYHMTLETGFYRLQNKHKFNVKNALLTRTLTLRMCAKVLLHVWAYDFYDMTLSTEYPQHM